MRSFFLSLALSFIVVFSFAWIWGLDHRLYFLSRDYALMVGKERLISGYSRPGLAVFGDSTVMDGVVPEQLGPGVINCAMNGSTPIESYFLVRRLLEGKIRPKAILISYNAYHLVHPDFYWENTVKFGLVRSSEADEVMGHILGSKDKELLNESSPGHLEQRLYSFLLSRGFPSYYVSSLYAEPFGARRKENEEALKTIARTRGQYYFPIADGSKSLNADTKLKSFAVSPVVDLYLRKTVDLLEKEGIPAYFYVMPINESSVSHLNPEVFDAFKAYLAGIAQEHKGFRILSTFRTVYPWKCFSDHAHLNPKGTRRFNIEFSRILNQAKVPGGPYGVLTDPRDE